MRVDARFQELAVIPDPKGYYATLEVHPTASPALIRAAYRVRAMELHPDRSESLSSTLDFQRLQEAFEVLGDPVRKSAYDDWALQMTNAAARSRAAVVAPPEPRRRHSMAIPAGVAAAASVVLGGWFLFSGDEAYPESSRAVAQAKPPAGSQAATPLLVELQRLPTSGILQLDLPSEAFADSEHLPRLKLTAPRDASYLVKLSTWTDNRPAMSVFVRAGETTEVLVPVGRYHIRLASGVDWYGEQVRFGPNTQYAQVDSMSEFQSTENRLLRHELLLGHGTGTEVAATAIPASSF